MRHTSVGEVNIRGSLVVGLFVVQGEERTAGLRCSDDNFPPCGPVGDDVQGRFGCRTAIVVPSALGRHCYLVREGWGDDRLGD